MSSTHFGFKTVDEKEKAKHVRGVFDSVASKYDIMNDLMSVGLHRVWKAYTVQVANLKEGDRALDIAGGTGDLSLAFSKKVGNTGQVFHTDINEAMLRTGRDRLVNEGVILPTLVCDAEKLTLCSGCHDSLVDSLIPTVQVLPALHTPLHLPPTRLLLPVLQSQSLWLTLGLPQVHKCAAIARLLVMNKSC